MKYLSRFILFSLAMSTFSYAGIEDVFKGKTEIKNPLELRDPFQAPKFKHSKKSKLKNKKDDGVWSDVVDPTGIPLSEIKIIGILVGKDRRAMIETKDKSIITVKEGMRLGENEAEVKAILPGGLILVEKITNVYGEAEYIETVIPISR